MAELRLMEWMLEPTAWMGFFTLVLLELVLGIDNLIFIAILAQRLPAHQRDRARQIGLLLALGMRLVLLTVIAWLASLTEPLVDILGKTFSGRDLILLVGGMFLLFKATSEIHSRLEGRRHGDGAGAYKAKFWMVITQIVVLDAVFSLDAVVTAVGMTDHLGMMMAAVTVAIVLMIFISKPLTAFVNKHFTIVMLCLGFLLMVGFSLVAEGFGAHIPKGYLYAAIGFSVLIEAINQFAHAKFRKRVAEAPDIRERTADMLLKALGARKADEEESTAPQEIGMFLNQAAQGDVLSTAEKELLRGVLNLTERPASSIMTPRTEIEWIDINEGEDGIREQLTASHRSQLLVGRDMIDNIIGVLDREDCVTPLLRGEGLPKITSMMKEPLVVHENTSVIKLLELFKKKPVDMAIVTNEFGGVQGIITHHDLLEAIAGEFPDEEDPEHVSNIITEADGVYLIDGMTPIHDVRDLTGLDIGDDAHFSTMAGFTLNKLAHVPAEGEKLSWDSWTLEIVEMERKRIAKVRLTLEDLGEA